MFTTPSRRAASAPRTVFAETADAPGTFADALKVPFGRAIEGSLKTSLDVDYYRLTLPEAGYYLVTLQYLDAPDPDSSIRLVLERGEDDGFTSLDGSSHQGVYGPGTISRATYRMEDSDSAVRIALSGYYGDADIDPSLYRITLARVDEFQGTGEVDLLTGHARADFMKGRGGSDTLLGRAGHDSIHGGGGDDSLEGGAGEDLLHGGPGDDTILGGKDADLAFGEDGHDVFLGGGAIDMAFGGDGHDILSGGAETDFLNGNNGRDRLDGGAGDDSLSGDDGRDSLHGGAGNDYLSGDFGRDRLNGGDGDDRLVGGQGRDTLIAGAGEDRLIGGGGADLVALGAPDASRDAILFTAEDLRDGGDTVAGFETGMDVVDLYHIDTDPDRRGDQSFAWGDRRAVAMGLWWSQDGEDVLVHVDRTGDAVADHSFRMTGLDRLGAADFLL